ncbi:MAG: hypothetical protein NC184_07985 [Roseburia sp.]|nr:hypothetical protein [Roseburia sp.]
MKGIKKFVVFLLSIILVFTLCACANGNPTDESKGREEQSESTENEKEPVWHCYTLKQAYDNKWLTQDDLLSIAYYYDCTDIFHDAQFNSELMGDGYEPKPKIPQELDEQTSNGMIQAYLNEHMQIKKEDAWKYNIENDNIYYLGAYNGCVAAIIRYFGGTQANWAEVVAGVAFSYPHGGVQILIWKEAA